MFKNCKHLTQFVLEEKVISKKIIWYFSQCTDILKRGSGVGSGNYIYFWKSKELSEENITAHTTTYCRLNPQLSYLSTKTRAEFKRSYLKQDKIMYVHGKEVNIYIVYEKNKNFNISSYSALENCLFGVVSLTTNDDIDKYKYS